MRIDDNLTASTYLRPAQTERVQTEPLGQPPGGRSEDRTQGDSVSLSSLVGDHADAVGDVARKRSPGLSRRARRCDPDS